MRNEKAKNEMCLHVSRRKCTYNLHMHNTHAHNTKSTSVSWRVGGGGCGGGVDGSQREKSEWNTHDNIKTRNKKHSTTGTQSKTCYGEWHRERTTSCFRHSEWVCGHNAKYSNANGPTGKLTLHDNNMRNLNIRTSGSWQKRRPNQYRRGCIVRWMKWSDCVRCHFAFSYARSPSPSNQWFRPPDAKQSQFGHLDNLWWQALHKHKHKQRDEFHIRHCR